MPGEAAQRGAELGLDAITGRATVSARTTYLALLTAAPTDATTVASMAEITTAGYARQAVTWRAPAGDPAQTSNSVAITFGPFTADPPNITHVALVSSASGGTGDFLWHWALDLAKNPDLNESLQFPVDFLVAQLD